MKSFSTVLVFASLFLVSTIARAWGQYGHEQINSAAIDLLGTDNPLGQCFNQGRYAVKRYAITPDMEWKSDVSLPNLSHEDASKRSDDDKYEHALHFDEVDAYVKNPSAADIAGLPSADYSLDLFNIYANLLSSNADYVTLVDPVKKLADPAHPTVNEVTDHGTAPWRALQLYRLGVAALKNGDLQLGVLYLATMGHYVGDMSQPFHATLNYDGGYPSDASTAGIHHEIDTGVLPDKGKDHNDVYPDFSVTDAAVKNAASQSLANQGLGGLQEGSLVEEIFQMIAPGYQYVDSFLQIYSGYCSRAEALPMAEKIADKGAHVSLLARNTHEGNASEESSQHYCTTISSGSHAKTRFLPKSLESQFAADVLPTVEQRLGAAAALLARIWASAYEAAGRPALGDCSNFSSFDGLQSFAIQNYARPSVDGPHGYLPSGYTPGHRN